MRKENRRPSKVDAGQCFAFSPERDFMTENLAGRGEGMAGLREALKVATKELWHTQMPIAVNAAMPSVIPCVKDCVKCMCERALEAAAATQEQPAGSADYGHETNHACEHGIFTSENHCEKCDPGSPRKVGEDGTGRHCEITGTSAYDCYTTQCPDCPYPELKLSREQAINAICLQAAEIVALKAALARPSVGSPRKVGEDGAPADDMTYTETLARELALRVLGRSRVPISSYDSEAKAEELVDLLSVKHKSCDASHVETEEGTRLATGKWVLSSAQDALSSEAARSSSVPVGEQKQEEGV